MKRFSLFLVLLCALLVAAGLVPLAAQADTSYRLVGEVEPIPPDGFMWLGGPVAGDALGNVYVADGGAIYVYDAQGIWMTTISQWADGEQTDQFNGICDIAIDNNVLKAICVGADGKNRIVELSIQEGSFGSFERSFSCGPGARAMAFDSAGNAWVLNVVWSAALEREQETLNRFSPAGESLGSLDFSTSVPVEQTPRDLAIGPDDSVYVSMESYRDILVFNSEGAYQKSWSVSEYEHTQRIAVNAEGLVLVSLSSGVGVFTANGTPVTHFAGDDLHGVAQEVAVGATGDVYVVDSRDPESSVLVYRGFEIPTYTFVRDYPDLLADPSDLQGPIGIAVDEAGNVYVADFNPSKFTRNVVKYDAQGNQVWYVDGGESRPFEAPMGVAVLDGLVYVTDLPANRIVVLDADDGKWIRDITADWPGAPESWGPRGIRFDANGSLWVVDNGGGRPSYVQQLDTNGTLLSSFTFPEDVNYPNWLALDAFGNVYVTDSDSSLVKFDSVGNRLARWDLPQGGWAGGIDVDADGLVYAGGVAGVHVFNSTGTWITRFGDADGTGKLSHPFGLTLAADGTIYVGDSGGPLVKSFTKNGGTVSTDLTAPTVDCTLSGLTGVNGKETGWFIGPVTAEITADDVDDAVASIEWELYEGESFVTSDGAEGDHLQLLVPTAGDGMYALSVRATDSNGNTSEWAHTAVQIDTVSPGTVIMAPEETDWYNYTPLQVQFWPTLDLAQGVWSWITDLSGMGHILYQVDPSDPPFAGDWLSLPVTGAWPPNIFAPVAGEGLHKVIGRAVDVAGNAQDPWVMLEIGIDLTKPQVTVTRPVEGGVYQLLQENMADFSADDTLSGIDYESYPGDLTFDTDSVGPKTFQLTIYDVAGNFTTKTVNYTVVATPADTTPPTLVLGPAVYDGAAYGVSLLGQPLDFSVVDESGGSGASTNGSASVLVPGTPTPQTIPLAWTTNANGTTSASGTLPTGVAGAYTLTLSGRDQAGNLVTKTLTYYAAGTASPIAGLGGLPRDANGTPLLDVTKYSPTKFLTLSFTLLDSAGKPVNNASPRLYVYDTATGSQRFRALLPFAPLGKGKYVFLWFPRLLKWDPSWPHDYRDMQLIIKFYDKTSGKLVTATVKQGADGALVATPLAATGAKAATTTPPTTPTTTSSKIRVRW